MTIPASRGRFITFEGIEGCGKSTQVRLLESYLVERRYGVEVLREPGGTPIGEAIRRILLDAAHSTMAPVTELLLYEAARAQLVAERIRPALDAGRLVLCDRFYDSTTAYQGGGRGLPRDFLMQCNEGACNGLKPDLTLLLDVPVNVGLQRVTNAGHADRIEQESAAFHERVRRVFLEIARQEPDRVKVFDGTRPVERVAAEIRGCIEAFLKRHEL